VSQEECAGLRESVPYVKVYRYNPKHLYPKLNGYGDNDQRKMWSSCGSKYCNLHSWKIKIKLKVTKKTGRRQLRIEELGETWLRRRKPTKGCSAK
jgi:hypothetical protein